MSKNLHGAVPHTPQDSVLFACLHLYLITLSLHLAESTLQNGDTQKNQWRFCRKLGACAETNISGLRKLPRHEDATAPQLFVRKHKHAPQRGPDVYTLLLSLTSCCWTIRSVSTKIHTAGTPRGCGCVICHVIVCPCKNSSIRLLSWQISKNYLAHPERRRHRRHLRAFPRHERDRTTIVSACVTLNCT